MPKPYRHRNRRTREHVDEVNREERDALLQAVDAPPPAPSASPASPVPASVTTVEDVAPSEPGAPTSPRPAEPGSPPDLPASALDELVTEAVLRRGALVDRGDTAGRDARLREAVEELLRLDPGRVAAWYLYGRLAPSGEEGSHLPQSGGSAPRRAFLSGRLRRLADADDRAGIACLAQREHATVEDLLARPEGAEVAAAVVAAHLDDVRVAARLLDAVPLPCEGWEDLVAEVRDRVGALPAAGPMVEAELLLRAVEEALWRWAPPATGGADGAGGPDRLFAVEATRITLQRVACRRQRSDFVGAARLLGTVEDAWLDGPARARAACERALVGADIPGPEAVRFPRDEGERTRMRERLGPVRERLVEAADLDPGALLPNLLLGVLLWCEGDPAAAGRLTVAQEHLAEPAAAQAHPVGPDAAAAVRFHAALARLRLLEPGTDEGGYRDMASALDAGYRPGPEDLVSAAVALEAHGSPHAGAFLAAAVAVAPGDPDLVRLLADCARTGDEEACRRIEELAASSGLPLASRFELLDAALAGAGCRRASEDAVRLAGAIDDLLVRAGDVSLDERFAHVLATNETLRLALDPANAEALRLEVLRRIGRLDEARAIAQALFYRAAGGGLRAFDPADLFDVLVELGHAPAELDELARLLPSPPDGEEPSPLRDPVRVLFVGGSETQERYRAAVEAATAERYDGQVSLIWVLPGWRSNWHDDVARIEAAYAQVDIVVLMTFVRTHLGQRVRRSAGEHGLPWVACTGHGRVAIERAIDRAVAVVGERAAMGERAAARR